MYRIMIVEDDPALCALIREGLNRWKFEPAVISDFEEVLTEFVRLKPHLVIMDINLPYYDGYYWCSRIREISRIPIVFLSSRDTNMDIVMAVNLGGDDYITKPFSMDILTAKLSALLRRTYSYGEGGGETVECDGVILNVDEGALLFNDKKMELTRNELKILLLLMKNRGKIVSRERVMRSLWDDDEYVNDNTLTVNVNRLRSKLEDMGLDDFIVTKKGQGYIVS
jgi:DNA-binding response OmpR family regulator